MEIEWKKIRRRLAALEFDLLALEAQNALTRSQLSEALNKPREHREAEERESQSQKELAEAISVALIGAAITAGMTELYKSLGDPKSDSRLACGGEIPKGQWKSGDSEQFAAGEYIIPHHGPGLSEAEDAMRDDAWYTDHVGPDLKHPTDEPAQPLKSQPLRLILERVGNTSRIYYRVQDRITCINNHQGIADSIEAAFKRIPAEDRARIAEERRYGMGVGK